MSACGLMMKCCGHNDINKGKNKLRRKYLRIFQNGKK
jgi:hypothetical protein